MRVTRIAGLSLAALAAVLWALGVTILQPLTEPIGPWPEALPVEGTYWARDLRFSAIVAVVLGLVLAGRGDRRQTIPAVVLGGLWVAADVAVDRLDLSGAGPTVLLAAAGCAAVATAALPGVRRHPPVADRRVLVSAACVAAVSALVAAVIESPTGREPELTWATVSTALLLVALAAGCALAAAPASGSGRRGSVAALAGLTAVGVVLLRVPTLGARIPLAILLGAALLIGITFVAWDRPGGGPEWRWHALGGLGAVVGAPTMLFLAVLAMVKLRVGAPFTALAGNTAIEAAGNDVLYSLAGLLAGLGTALLLAWPPALGHRPAAAGRPGRPDVPPATRSA
ncbi:hypothetical protein [Micromonospora endolithica]|uniref:Uncharacterized protein n=1 Tax=Micromonospora endolithica TaxID=230091 RepID=A0A3A9ZMM9_9ACTN|nr:hypothetical protein [Micromonospora endolithica]RKN49562.1 hypothetical protein D7223_08815 [Micromonospora endolithica]TWJ23779.1 hypothetical protein JD76_03922 [Micromonospora endolithica]